MMLIVSLLVGQPIVVGEDATVKARPWEMRWADVYRKVEKGSEQFVVVGADAKGATRCDDGPKVGDVLTRGDGTTLTIERGKVYRCFLHDGVPSMELKDRPRRPVVEAVRNVVEFVTPPYCPPGGS